MGRSRCDGLAISLGCDGSGRCGERPPFRHPSAPARARGLGCACSVIFRSPTRLLIPHRCAGSGIRNSSSTRTLPGHARHAVPSMGFRNRGTHGKNPRSREGLFPRGDGFSGSPAVGSGHLGFSAARCLGRVCCHSFLPILHAPTSVGGVTRSGSRSPGRHRHEYPPRSSVVLDGGRRACGHGFILTGTSGGSPAIPTICLEGKGR
jgi:hypothetical protein